MILFAGMMAKEYKRRMNKRPGYASIPVPDEAAESMEKLLRAFVPNGKVFLWGFRCVPETLPCGGKIWVDDWKCSSWIREGKPGSFSVHGFSPSPDICSLCKRHERKDNV